MSRLSHRTSVITTGSSRVPLSHTPDRIGYTTMMLSYIGNSNSNNEQSNNKSTTANSAPPALLLEQEEEEAEAKVNAAVTNNTDNHSMFDITQRELNAMYDSMQAIYKHKWRRQTSSSLPFRVRQYALQRRHIQAESKPQITRYNTFMVKKQLPSPTLPVILDDTQPSLTVEAIRAIHLTNEETDNNLFGNKLH